MTELSGQTLDILAKNIEEIKYLFPDAFTENKIDFDKLKQILGEYVNDNVERYNFSWNGKGKALRLAQSPSTGTLRPCKKESNDWNNTKNIYIEGDNLEVLKLLQKSYYSKIKLIYIDPPYNTGKDFVYSDNYQDTLKNYLNITGQYEKNGLKVSTNTDTSGRYHTNWLNMMYPRLRLARNLLKDDGAIFISIDDNEIENLKKLCNEIFGEENFIAQFPWQSRQSIQNDTDISNNHEYILSYAKIRRKENRRLKESNSSKWFNERSFACLPLELDKDKFDNPDNDSRGLWKADPFDAPNIRPNLTYVIENPITKEKFLPPQGRCWRTEEKTYKKLLDDNRIIFGKTGESRPQLKVFYEEKKIFGSIDNTWWTGEKCGTSTQGTKEQMQLFNGVAPFDTPKPVKLLSKIINLVSLPENNDIILDFFSGSATTADAVMQVNMSDNGNRKFIMVQIPEPIDKKSEIYKYGYKNICEIGKERIRRAGDNIKKKNGLLAENVDIGFKVFKLDSSNIRKWNPDYDNLEKSLINYIDNYVEGRSDIDVIYEIMLKMGLDLNYLVEENYIDGKKIYCIEQGKLIVCLDSYITTTIAEKIVKLYHKHKLKSWKIVFKNNCFINDSIKINVYEILKCAGLDNDSFITL